MKLEIISPEKFLFNGDADAITLPGAGGVFSIMDKHVPMFSILKTGTILVKKTDSEVSFDIKDGVVEVKNNVLVICVNE